MKELKPALPSAGGPPRERYVTLHGLHLHCLEWGEPGRQPILLLHGGSAHAHWWHFFATALAGGYHLIALDLRGHGDSDWVRPPDYTLDAYSTDVERFRRKLGLRDFFIVGHSLGALVAAAYAVNHRPPAGLVLVDPPSGVRRRTARFLDVLGGLPHPTYASMEEFGRRFRFMPEEHCARDEVVRHVLGRTVRPLADGTLTLKFDRRALTRTIECDLHPLLAELACPLLLVRGGWSRVVSAKTLAKLAATVPGARSVTIENAYHHVMLDQPELLAQTVKDFLRDLGGDRPAALLRS